MESVLSHHSGKMSQNLNNIVVNKLSLAKIFSNKVNRFKSSDFYFKFFSGKLSSPNFPSGNIGILCYYIHPWQAGRQGEKDLLLEFSCAFSMAELKRQELLS